MIRLLYQLVAVHYANGDLDGVEAAVRTILATVPNDLASLQFLGLVYYRTGRRDQAMQIFDSAPDAKVSAEPSPSDHGNEPPALPLYSAAAACHAEATHRNSSLAQAWYDLGLTLAQLGRPAPATVAFRSALIARPAFPEAVQALRTMEPCANDASVDEGGAASPPLAASVGARTPGTGEVESGPGWNPESAEDDDE